MNHRDKVAEIFQELVGDRATRLRGDSFLGDVRDRITRAVLHEEMDSVPKAEDIGFHMIDWQSEAAFMVALALFPEKFTDEEIRSGIEAFLIHAPAHILEACRLHAIEAADLFTKQEPMAEPDADGNSVKPPGDERTQ